MSKRNIKIAGRVLSFLLFIHLSIVLTVSTVYGAYQLSLEYPRLVGTPLCISLGCSVVLLAVFLYRLVTGKPSDEDSYYED